jgi:hypothetical protein
LQQNKPIRRIGAITVVILSEAKDLCMPVLNETPGSNVEERRFSAAEKNFK